MTEVRGLRQYYADLSASGVFQVSAKLEPAKFRAAKLAERHWPANQLSHMQLLEELLGV